MTFTYLIKTKDTAKDRPPGKRIKKNGEFKHTQDAQSQHTFQLFLVHIYF